MRYLSRGTRRDLKCLLPLFGYPVVLALAAGCLLLNFIYRRTENKAVLIAAWAAVLALLLFLVVRYRPGACGDGGRDGQEAVSTVVRTAPWCILGILVIILYLFRY